MYVSAGDMRGGLVSSVSKQGRVEQTSGGSEVIVKVREESCAETHVTHDDSYLSVPKKAHVHKCDLLLTILTALAHEMKKKKMKKTTLSELML